MGIPLHVLLVEDSESDAVLVTRALRRAGYEPISQRVKTEGALRKELQQPSWEIVLADFALPGFNGLAALKVVRQLRPDLPFILVSGTVGEDTAVAAMKSGANDFVLKKSLSRLRLAVERELRDAEMRRAWRRAEQELRDREARFRAIIENVSDLIIVLDMRGIIRFQSPSVERILRYRPVELAGTSVYNYVHCEDAPRIREVLAERAQKRTEDHGRSPLLECRVRHRDGRWRILEFVVTDLLNDPAVQGIVCTLRDITEHKQMEAERLRAQRLESLGSLASGIAHDLNNLLTPILISTDVLAEELADGEHRELLEGLQVSTQRAASVVQHLLSFACGRSGGRDQVDLGAVIRDLERMLRFSLPKNIERRVSLPSELWPVYGDTTQLLQVLVNLSVNARDAMPHGGKLTVEAENAVLSKHNLRDAPDAEPGSYVHIRVTDTGEGFPPQIRERVFEPFFTTKEKGRGTGLGLSTSLSIVHEHGGFMRVYSEVDRGTRFSVYLPATVAPETGTDEGQIRDLPHGDGELTLIVDDEASFRNMLKETLEAYGYQTAVAADGSEAVALATQKRGQIRLAIINLMMPLMDGPATIQALRQIDPEMRIIAQGAFVANGRKRLSREKVDGILERPYTVEQVLRSVAMVLQK